MKTKDKRFTENELQQRKKKTYYNKNFVEPGERPLIKWWIQSRCETLIRASVNLRNSNYKARGEGGG